MTLGEEGVSIGTGSGRDASGQQSSVTKRPWEKKEKMRNNYRDDHDFQETDTVKAALEDLLCAV